MNIQLLRRLIAPAMLGLLMCGFAPAQPKSSKSFPPGPCHQNIKACAQRMNSQLGVLNAYAKRLKPGDTVSFNPQPDPPGSPDPGYRQARVAFGLLQEEIADLAKYPPSEKVGAVNDAQEKFGRLAQASNGASFKTALAAMKPSIRRLSN